MVIDELHTRITCFPLQHALVLPGGAGGGPDALLHLLHLSFLLVLRGRLRGLGNEDGVAWHTFHHKLRTLASNIHKMRLSQKSMFLSILFLAGIILELMLVIWFINPDRGIPDSKRFSKQLFLTQTYSVKCYYSFTSTILAKFLYSPLPL